MNRRSFFKYASNAVASFWLVRLMYRKGSEAFAQEKPPLSESDSTAQELGYKEDNTKVDTTKFPNKAGEAGKNQKCSLCKFYSAIDAKHGDCMIFVNNTVTANGWCSYWEQRA